MDDNLIEFEKITALFEQLKLQAGNDEEKLRDLQVVTNLIDDNSFQPLIKVHQSLKKNSKLLSPSCVNALDLIQHLHELSKDFPSNDILSVLSTLFNSSHHLLALMSCHDKIADGTFDEPQISDFCDESMFKQDDNEETMKVVRLVKSDEPLGATIATDEISGDIVIARILKGGAADRSGLIHVNDVLVEVNDVSARGKKPAELIKLLAGFKGPLTFKLIPGESPKEIREEDLFIRALFTYLPLADSLIPCIEAGLTFYSGDILKVVSKDDISWWQATKIESSDKTKLNGDKVGLIPSLKLQTRREKLKRQAQIKASRTSIKGSNMSLISNGRKNAWNMIRASFRRKRYVESSATNSGQTSHHLPYFLPYEIVSLYNPLNFDPKQKRKYRPMVLVGPQGVGRNDLKDSLIDSNPSHYGVPVPHTSRLHQPGEVNGKDYHFVSREFMENGIKQGRFLEYGEYKGNFYGTSLDSVHDVINSGLVCVLTPYPQALKTLRSKEFMSYIIFVRPPSVVDMGRLEEIQEYPSVTGKLTLERSEGVPFTDDEMKNLANRAEIMNSVYGRLFDATIINDSSDHAFNQLKEISFFLENDQQWVPAEWLS